MRINLEVNLPQVADRFMCALRGHQFGPWYEVGGLMRHECGRCTYSETAKLPVADGPPLNPERYDR